jgi:hypothetical protein
MKPLSFKEKAINYRKRGYSYGMILERLELSKSTLSDWLKEIPYKPNKEVIKRVGLARMKSAQFKHNQKVANIRAVKKLAKRELGKLTKRDLWFLGIGLYWGEGDKSSNEGISVVNSDPETIKTMIKWFREICGLATKNFAPTIHAYPENNIAEEINYWSKLTGIPKEQFNKTQIDRRTNKSKMKKRKLPHGTLRLAIRSNGKKEFGVFLHRRIMGWIEAI